MSLPAVTATGRLAADPELRYTQAGHAVASLRIACTDRRRTPSGDWEDGDTTWLDVTAWRNLAEAAAEHLTKGDLVAVTGRLTQREHNGKTYHGITADTLARGLQTPGRPAQRTQSPQPQDPWGTPTKPSDVW
ncbi:single-stranded DNA-binding protein [Nocardioides pakistanensis]